MTKILTSKLGEKFYDFICKAFQNLTAPLLFFEQAADADSRGRFRWRAQCTRLQTSSIETQRWVDVSWVDHHQQADSRSRHYTIGCVNVPKVLKCIQPKAQIII